jgi:hypothetical protein
MIERNQSNIFLLLQNLFTALFRCFAPHHILKYALSQEHQNSPREVNLSFIEKDFE